MFRNVHPDAINHMQDETSKNKQQAPVIATKSVIILKIPNNHSNVHVKVSALFQSLTTYKVKQNWNLFLLLFMQIYHLSFFSPDLILLPCFRFCAVFLQHNHQFMQRVHQHHHNLLITTDHNNQGTLLNMGGIPLIKLLGPYHTLWGDLLECQCQRRCQCQASLSQFKLCAMKVMFFFIYLIVCSFVYLIIY